MNLFGLMETSGGAMQAERMRAEVVAANMANAETTQNAHRRRLPPSACGLRRQSRRSGVCRFAECGRWGWSSGASGAVRLPQEALRAARATVPS